MADTEHGVFKMLRMGRGDIDQLHLFILHQLLIGTVRLLKAVFLRERLRLFQAP